jgi:hypothetical protein
MLVRLLRRFFALLIMSAYLSATVLAAMPIANAAAVEMGSGMMHQQDGASHEIPCKGKMPTCCMTGLGCVFMASLPAAGLAASTSIAWSLVTYSGSLDSLHGRTIRPALGPLISRA